MNKENLKKLANYLLSGNLKADFSMQFFTSPEVQRAYSYFATTCGTVGCALGHAPYLGILKTNKETWREYSKREFVDIFSNEGKWCFHGTWHTTDNTAKGAGKRILYLLNHGLPKDWESQMMGITPLCYK